MLAALVACGGGDAPGDTTPATASSTSPANAPTADTPKVWGSPLLLESDNAGSASAPQIAFDASGNAIAVWGQSDGTRLNIWARRFSAASGTWDSAQSIQTDNTSSGVGPRVAFDAGGNAVAVWEQFDSPSNNIWANRFSAASGTWGTAQLIETSIAGSAVFPEIALDAGGNAIAIWHQFDGTRSDIWANRFSAASGTWGTAQLIETDNAGRALFPQVVLDASGNAIAVWEQFDGTRSDIWANRFSAASGTWGTAQLIDIDDASDASFPRVALDPSGNAVAVWQQYDGTRTNIWANRFSAASGAWGTAELIETGNGGGAVLPRIALDASGNAIAVWHQFDGTRSDIWASRFSAASGAWGAAQLIETDNAGDAFFPEIAVDAGGNGIAVWAQSDGTRFNIWANRFQ